MPALRPALVLAAGLLGACQPVPEDMPAPAPSPPPASPFKGRWDELSLFRDACEIECAAFEVILRPSGEVLWRGVAGVEARGVRLGRVEPARIDRVVERLVAAGLLGAHEEYDTQRTHGRVTVVSLTLDGKPRRVRDRGGDAPEPLRAALEAIDALAPEIQWYPADPGVAAAPSACELVFSSAQRVCEAYFLGEGTHERCEHALALSSLAATVVREGAPATHTRACALIAASPMLRPPAEAPPLTIGVPLCRELHDRIRDACLPDRRGTLDCHVAMDMVDLLHRDERERRAGTHEISEETDTNLCRMMLRRLD